MGWGSSIYKCPLGAYSGPWEVVGEVGGRGRGLPGPHPTANLPLFLSLSLLPILQSPAPLPLPVDGISSPPCSPHEHYWASTPSCSSSSALPVLGSFLRDWSLSGAGSASLPPQAGGGWSVSLSEKWGSWDPLLKVVVSIQWYNKYKALKCSELHSKCSISCYYY